jgi:hypothetical protein
MKEFDLGTCLTIEAPDRFETDTETHIWLPVKDAQNVARRLINMNAIFSYLPVPGDEETVEIECGSCDLSKCITMYYEVK